MWWASSSTPGLVHPVQAHTCCMANSTSFCSTLANRARPRDSGTPVQESSWRANESPASPSRTMSRAVKDTEVLVANSV